jgi:glycosyltransferase involved in cell wall biosynthesis
MTHVLIVADGRSPITLGWIRTVQAQNIRVSLVSTFPCRKPNGVEQMYVVPVAFAWASERGGKPKSNNTSSDSKQLGLFKKGFAQARHILGPLTLPFYRKAFRRIVEQVNPDVVHALRIPFEGMLASYTPRKKPLVTSIWGNDLTLHAPASLAMRQFTRRCLRRSDALLADVQRDIRLAALWGFRTNKPYLVVPGGGGIDLEKMHRIGSLDAIFTNGIPKDAKLIINPRGLRLYVRNDTFFEAIKPVIQIHPEAFFVCPAMVSRPEAEKWVEKYGIQKHVKLLPMLTQTQLWALFKKSEITISISTHDGTPNTLLEAMAQGCLPIVGDLDSLREWITPGINGTLVPYDNPRLLAEAIIQALETPDFRKRAAKINRTLIEERADVHQVGEQIAAFYQKLA